MQPQFAGRLKLLAQLVHVNELAEPHVRGAILKREGDAGGGKVLPDELEHEQLVEVGVEQGARDRIEFPVVVMRAASNVDDHNPYST